MARKKAPPPPTIGRDRVTITIYPFGDKHGYPAWIQHGTLVCVACAVHHDTRIVIVEPAPEDSRHEDYVLACQLMRKQGLTCVTSTS